MKNNKQDLIVRETPAVPVLQRDRPEFLKVNSGRGLEDINRQDLVLPRLSICQSMTPQRKKTDLGYIDGLEEGQFFNSLTGEIYPEELRFIPVLVFKSRLYFTPMEEGGGLLCQSLDAKSGQLSPKGCDVCPHSAWQGENSPDCTLLYNYAGILLPTRELIVVSLKTSGIKTAKQWNSIMRLKQVDSFAGIYRLSTSLQKNNAGEWYTLQVKPTAWVDEDTFKFCSELFATLRQTGVKFDTEGISQPETEGEVIPF